MSEKINFRVDERTFAYGMCTRRSVGDVDEECMDKQNGRISTWTFTKGHSICVAEQFVSSLGWSWRDWTSRTEPSEPGTLDARTYSIWIRCMREKTYLEKLDKWMLQRTWTLGLIRDTSWVEIASHEQPNNGNGPCRACMAYWDDQQLLFKPYRGSLDVRSSGRVWSFEGRDGGKGTRYSRNRWCCDG